MAGPTNMPDWVKTHAAIAQPSDPPMVDPNTGISWAFDGLGGATPTAPANSSTASKDASVANKNNAQAAKDSWIVTRDTRTGQSTLLHVNADGSIVNAADGQPDIKVVGSDDYGKQMIEDLANQGKLRNSQGTYYDAQTAYQKIQAQNAALEEPGKVQGQQLTNQGAGIANQISSEKARQLIEGALTTEIRQIAADPNMSVTAKQKLIDSRVNSAVNQLDDTLQKMTALNSYQATKADQAAKMAQSATQFVGNTVNSAMDLAKAGGFGAGDSIAAMLKAGPGILASFGGGPQDLKNPLDLWETPGAGNTMDLTGKSLLNGGTDSSSPLNGAGPGSPGFTGGGAAYNGSSSKAPTAAGSPLNGANPGDAGFTGGGAGVHPDTQLDDEDKANIDQLIKSGMSPQDAVLTAASMKGVNHPAVSQYYGGSLNAPGSAGGGAQPSTIGALPQNIDWNAVRNAGHTTPAWQGSWPALSQSLSSPASDQSSVFDWLGQHVGQPLGAAAANSFLDNFRATDPMSGQPAVYQGR